MDRITRNLKDFCNLWEDLRDRGIEIVVLDHDIDTSTAGGRAMMAILMAFYQMERETTAERTSSKMHWRAEHGLWNGGHVFGYDLDSKQKGILIVNPKEAKIIRELFHEKFLELGSAGKLARFLADNGIRTKEFTSRRGKKKNPHPFSK